MLYCIIAYIEAFGKKKVITMKEKKDSLIVDGENLDLDNIQVIEKANKLIKNRSLVKYKITNDDLNVIFDLKELDNTMGIVVGNVKYKEVEWVYDSDLYGTGQTPPKRPKKNKVNQIFDYLFGALDKNGEIKEKPIPSLSIDTLIDKALSKISTDLTYYEDPFWSLEEEERLISGHLNKEAEALSPDPAKEEGKDKDSVAYDDLTGWVRVAWPDKGVTTIEHVSFLEELCPE